jgi:hypothetical protein
MPWGSSELFITLSLLAVETNTLQELKNNLIKIVHRHASELAFSNFDKILK